MLAPIEEIPIFVKAGAIILTQKVVKYIKEKEINEILLMFILKEILHLSFMMSIEKVIDCQDESFSTTRSEPIKENGATKIIIHTPIWEYSVSERTYVT